jgi:hypothetical protein
VLRGGARPRLAIALDYAARGWRVVPLHVLLDGRCTCGTANCTAAGKHPRLRAWPQRASCNRSTIESWWGEWPEANVGIVTGSRSGLVALDVDPRNGGDETLAELEHRHGPLPATAESATGGGGRHILFACPARAYSRELGPGVEFKGDVTLIVAPPSEHASGRRYEWRRGRGPEEIGLATLPPWVTELISQRELRSGRHAATPERIPVGERNSTLTRIAGLMSMIAVPPEAIRAALAATNRERCVPPLPDVEVEGIARSAQRWDALPWLSSPREFFADERLHSTACLVLRVLCDHADAYGRCHPTYETLKAQSGIGSDATIAEAIRELETAGRIAVKREHRKPNRYRIHPSLPQRREDTSTTTSGTSSSETEAKAVAADAS